MKLFPLLCINMIAGSAILPHRILNGTATAENVEQSNADTDKFLGVSDKVGADEAGKRIDMYVAGIIPVTYGGTVAVGDYLTSDTQGRAIVAAAGDRYIGIAQEAGAVDEIGSVLISHGSLAA